MAKHIKLNNDQYVIKVMGGSVDGEHKPTIFVTDDIHNASNINEWEDVTVVHAIKVIEDAGYSIEFILTNQLKS